MARLDTEGGAVTGIAYHKSTKISHDDKRTHKFRVGEGAPDRTSDFYKVMLSS